MEGSVTARLTDSEALTRSVLIGATLYDQQGNHFTFAAPNEATVAPDDSP